MRQTDKKTNQQGKCPILLDVCSLRVCSKTGGNEIDQAITTTPIHIAYSLSHPFFLSFDWLLQPVIRIRFPNFLGFLEFSPFFRCSLFDLCFWLQFFVSAFNSLALTTTATIIFVIIFFGGLEVG